MTHGLRKTLVSLLITQLHFAKREQRFSRDKNHTLTALTVDSAIIHTSSITFPSALLSLSKGIIHSKQISREHL